MSLPESDLESDAAPEEVKEPRPDMEVKEDALCDQQRPSFILYRPYFSSDLSAHCFEIVYLDSPNKAPAGPSSTETNRGSSVPSDPITEKEKQQLKLSNPDLESDAAPEEVKEPRPDFLELERLCRTMIQDLQRILEERQRSALDFPELVELLRTVIQDLQRILEERQRSTLGNFQKRNAQEDIWTNTSESSSDDQVDPKFSDTDFSASSEIDGLFCTMLKKTQPTLEKIRKMALNCPELEGFYRAIVKKFQCIRKEMQKSVLDLETDAALVNLTSEVSESLPASEPLKNPNLQSPTGIVMSDDRNEEHQSQDSRGKGGVAEGSSKKAHSKESTGSTGESEDKCSLISMTKLSSEQKTDMPRRANFNSNLRRQDCGSSSSGSTIMLIKDYPKDTIFYGSTSQDNMKSNEGEVEVHYPALNETITEKDSPASKETITERLPQVHCRMTEVPAIDWSSITMPRNIPSLFLAGLTVECNLHQPVPPTTQGRIPAGKIGLRVDRSTDTSTLFEDCPTSTTNPNDNSSADTSTVLVDSPSSTTNPHDNSSADTSTVLVDSPSSTTNPHDNSSTDTRTVPGDSTTRTKTPDSDCPPHRLRSRNRFTRWWRRVTSVLSCTSQRFAQSKE